MGRAGSENAGDSGIMQQQQQRRILSLPFVVPALDIGRGGGCLRGLAMGNRGMQDRGFKSFRTPPGLWIRGLTRPNLFGLPNSSRPLHPAMLYRGLGLVPS